MFFLDHSLCFLNFIRFFSVLASRWNPWQVEERRTNHRGKTNHRAGRGKTKHRRRGKKTNHSGERKKQPQTTGRGGGETSHSGREGCPCTASPSADSCLASPGRAYNLSEACAPYPWTPNAPHISGIILAAVHQRVTSAERVARLLVHTTLWRRRAFIPSSQRSQLKLALVSQTLNVGSTSRITPALCVPVVLV